MDAERTGKRGPHQADTPPRVGNYVTARVGNYVTDNPSNLGKYVTADTWCPGQPVPGGFTEVDWDWTTCHKYNLVHRGMPPQVVGMTAEDGWYGGHPHYRTVAGENTNATCQFLGCP